MNLKERGITVGDLLLATIVIFSAIFIINKIKDNDKKVHFYPTHNEISTTKLSYLL